MPDGELIEASTALPPSPSFEINPTTPVPATVVIMPVLAVTIRMRLLPESEMNIFPDESIATACGSFN